MQDWDEIKIWRVNTRRALLDARAARSPAQQADAARVIGEALLHALTLQPGDWLGFYWPIRGEIDLRKSVTALVGRGAHAALPEVIARDAPLVFRPWQADCAMRNGTWDIPVPDTTACVTPTIVLIPCVAVDAEGYRLGYGGGFYDRTLAATSPRPLAIGIVLDEAVLPSIYPQAHDIPLDAVLCDQGWRKPLPRRPHIPACT